MPGSNPLFGLNALGGAIAIETKDGCTHPGTRAEVYGGSFSRIGVQAETGGGSATSSATSSPRDGRARCFRYPDARRQRLRPRQRYRDLELSESSRAPSPVELTCADEDDPCRLPNAFVADPPLEQVVATTLEAGVRGRAVPGGVDWHAGVFSTLNDNDILFISAGAARVVLTLKSDMRAVCATPVP